MSVNNRTNINLSCLMFIIAVTFFLIPSLKVLSHGDDHYFTSALTDRGLLDYISMRYHTWSGRIPVEALIALTINSELYWKIAIPVSFFSAAYAISRFAGFGHDGTILPLCLVSVLMLLINQNVMSEAGWWVTGSYFYLQPIAAGLLSLLIFKSSKNVGTFLKSLSLIFIAIACFNEQFSVLVALPFPALYMLFKKDYTKYNVGYLLIVIISTTISLTAPGNSVRKSSETLTWMPDYINFNVIDKIAIGLDRLSSHITEGNILFNSLLVVLLYVSLKGTKQTLATTGAALIISLKVAASLLNYTSHGLVNHYTNPAFLSLGEISHLSRFSPYIFSLLVIFSTLTLLMSLCKNWGDYFYLPLPFVLGILSVIAIGFSPTAYASAYRVLFIFNLYIVYLVSAIIHRQLAVRYIS
ncbi:DUF6056 family protein [Lelliottia sp. RWM.1]|uniref:DUF6056 family protein n=1 Tax=Lelliottia sp. RWM.1 TaxID=2663242 RepID=UPI00193E6509|nr:DUF6056 family protein [Lelliottia sp. RWM.1]MBM3074259.1 hypothetical protein [Lelliottia sp. RWM.1]